jgi:hypothetical protein
VNDDISETTNGPAVNTKKPVKFGSKNNRAIHVSPSFRRFRELRASTAAVDEARATLLTLGPPRVGRIPLSAEDCGSPIGASRP